MKLSQAIETLPNTHSITFNRFKALGINTFFDLLNYFPFRYENYSLISTIDKLQEGELVTIKGTLEKINNVYTKGGKKIQKGIVDDGTGKIEIIWFNQLYITRILHPGQFIAVAGVVKRFLNTITFEPHEYEALKSANAEPIHTGRLVPVYSEKYGLSSKLIREKLQKVLPFIQDDPLEFLPQEVITAHQLIDETEALKEIHFPKSLEKAEAAKKRLSFDELFTMQLSAALVRQEWKKETTSVAFETQKFAKDIEHFIKILPFPLTGAQKRSVDEIIHDLSQKNPMNRFLQGDVGSGKTVVATIAAYLAYLNGFQSLIMTPTEILAQQHYRTLSTLLEKYDITVGIQTGSKKDIKKSSTSDSQPFDIIVGTQALLTENLNFDKVGLIVIDEQHRFGVRQRAQLKQKGINPHLLTMTATPIPRTVALTMYGELDLSIIDEMPGGRLPIKTHLVPHNKRLDAYEWIRKQIKTEKVQVFIICPLIQESETESETMKSVKAATIEYEHLKTTEFKDFNVALLHGRIKSKEKDTIMKDFNDKKYDILVSTSVVEVGIDIPNATIMIIEGAERFGLAQLHQLRGRIGRGSKQSYCFLFTSSQDPHNARRLTLFTQTTSGNKLAEYDLKMRGPGQIYGTMQHGYLDLKIASFGDYDLIKQTKNATSYFLAHHTLAEYPLLQERIHRFQIDQVSRD